MDSVMVEEYVTYFLRYHTSCMNSQGEAHYEAHQSYKLHLAVLQKFLSTAEAEVVPVAAAEPFFQLHHNHKVQHLHGWNQVEELLYMTSALACCLELPLLVY